jgi:hypothetical protein
LGWVFLYIRANEDWEELADGTHWRIVVATLAGIKAERITTKGHSEYHAN